MQPQVPEAVRGRASAWSGLLALACWLLLPVAASASQSPLGLWRVEDAQARVRVVRCGEQLCGRILWLAEPQAPGGGPKLDIHNPDPELRGRAILGLEILERVSATPDEGGVYQGGRIYDPESGRSYRCRLSIEGDGRLRIRGWVGLSLFGRTTRWERVVEDVSGTAAQPPAHTGPPGNEGP